MKWRAYFPHGTAVGTLTNTARGIHLPQHGSPATGAKSNLAPEDSSCERLLVPVHLVQAVTCPRIVIRIYWCLDRAYCGLDSWWCLVTALCRPYADCMGEVRSSARVRVNHRLHLRSLRPLGGSPIATSNRTPRLHTCAAGAFAIELQAGAASPSLSRNAHAARALDVAWKMARLSALSTLSHALMYSGC